MRTVCLPILCLLLLALPASANIITVNSFGDTLNSADGVCSIREAIVNANNNAATWPNCAAGSGADVIFLPQGTIILSVSGRFEDNGLTGDLDIFDSLTINGSTTGNGTTISGATVDRIFDINPTIFGGGGGNPISVTLNDLNIQNGFTNGDGGGVQVAENTTVVMNACTVANCSTNNDGGGITNRGGTVTLQNCTVAGNSCPWLAGGIRNDGIMTITSCTITGNATQNTPGRGQGIGSFGVPVTIRNSIIVGNNATPANPEIEGSFVTTGYNLMGQIFLPAVAPTTGDQFGVTLAQVKLGALAYKNGPTPVYPLLAGSIAIDAGHSSGLTADQRHLVRPCDDALIANAAGGDGADIGAFEVQGTCATNQSPFAHDDSATFAEDSGPHVISVLANDTDPEGDPLIVSSVGAASHGTVVNNFSSVTYTPAPNFFGTDSFSYVAADGRGGSAPATVHITVTPIADPPDAVNDTFSVPEDSGTTSLNVRGNDTDPDGDTITVTAVTSASHGAVVNNGTSVSYTPAANYFGPDSFSYTVSDGNGGSDSATVSVNVTSVNDAPVAADDAYLTIGPLNVPAPGLLANDSDIDSASLSVVIVSPASHGTVVPGAGGAFTYTPTAGFSGFDSFTYKASDGAALSNLATVTIHVGDTTPPTIVTSLGTSQLWPVNHDLVNVGLSVTVSDNTTGPIATSVAVLSDEDDQTLQSGDQSPDARDIAPTTLRLRAERSAGGDGRVYLIVVTATDSSGNTSRNCQAVTVPKSLSAADVSSVNAQATAAKAQCPAPAGFFVVGDGPVDGPKQ